MTKYTKPRDEIKFLIKTINGGKVDGEYDKYFMKIKVSSDDNLLLNNTLKFHIFTVIVRSVFEKDDKFYPQDF